MAKLDNYECEGQMSLFDIGFLEQVKLKETVSEKQIFKVPWSSYNKETRYDGETRMPLIKGRYYPGYHEVTHEKDGYRISFVARIDGETKTGKKRSFGMRTFYKSLPELLNNWYIPELRDWVNEQVKNIQAQYEVSGVSTLSSTPYCTKCDGYLCNSHGRDKWENKKVRCKHGPGCCKYCKEYGKCGYDCKVKCEIDETYQLFTPDKEKYE